MTHLVWHSTFASPTGYSSSSREIVAELAALGLAVRPLYLFDSDEAERMYGAIPPHIPNPSTITYPARRTASGLWAR